MGVKRILSISKSFVLVALLIASFTETIIAQSVRPVDLIKQARVSQNFANVSPFNEGKRNVKNLPKEVKNYSILQMDKKMVSKLLSNSNTSMTLSLPGSSKRSFQLELIEVNLPAFSLVEAPAMTPVKYQDGRHYRGIVKGQPKSLVSISVFKDEIMGFISEERAQGNWVLGKMNDKSGDHILYEDTDLMAKLGFKCDTDESGVTYSAHELNNQNAARALTDCIGMYFEVDYNIFVNKGSLANTTAYVTGLYNQVATLYANEQILTNISEIVVWTSTSPYSGPSSSDMLNQFTAYRNGFNGNIAMLLSYSSSGGIAYVNTLCNSNPDYRMGFSSIYSSYSSVPTYSWSVEVVTHEFGHLVGSSHTHACVWNGNSTAIDGCYTPEGGCSNPGLPSNGGTIMSYCHLTSAGINFNNGFGPQPGNLIRSKVTAANCLAACSASPPSCTDGIQNGQETGIDCGGPSCPPCGSGCTANPGTITIVLDNYPNETTWNLKNSSGTTLYSGGPYSVAGSTVNVPICLPNGCYIFTIYDAFGDGICCSYGNGSYTVVVNGSTVANGGAFTSSAAHNFCANSTPATCSDGIQNQGETGIDCGGPNCPACPQTPTCNDGIQNQGETGIDCGGPNCPACPTTPTCNDGIQNQGETAIDCGGPNCPACSTCNDGIQNGNETGIDCGGSCGYPAVAITGPSNICIGTTTTLSPSTGGTWSSNNPAIATVNNSGLVTGVSAGATTFIFTKSNGCVSNPTNAITVNPRPTVSITGNSTICAGATTTLSPSSGGTWTSNNPAVATVSNTGLVTGVSGGSATFLFTNSSTGCTSNPTNPITINARPPVTITGSASICIGSTTTLSPTTGGSWVSSSNSIATVNNAGLVSGVSAGSATFTFTSSSTGCVSNPTNPVTVNPKPPVSITGLTAICPGTTTTLSPSTGGTWTSSNSSIATVANTGIVTGVAEGTANFTFTNSSTGCISNATSNVTVNARPTVSITGNSTICAGATTTLSPTNGGTWASSNTSIATVTNGGVVTGVSGGTVTFTYTKSSTGCTSNPTNPITINARPTVAITGSTSICIASTTTLSPSSGGTWVSSNNLNATVTNAGIVTGVSAGTATFTFTNTASGCVSLSTSPVTITAKPAVSITGSSTTCIGNTTTLSPATGGTWTSNNASVATVNNSGIVTGVSAGTSTFIFTDNASGCTSNPTNPVTITVQPTATITGSSALCIGAITTLSPVTGGTWTSSNPAIATVTNAGIVTGVSVGSATFIFTNSNGCTSNPTPAISVNTCSSLGAYYFESGWQGWIDGGTDCSRYNGPRSYEGTYSISIRDKTSSSKMTSPNFNVTAYNKLTVDFWFYPFSMESGEDFWLQYFNGTTWVTVGAWISGTDFVNNTFTNKVVTILKTAYTFPTNAAFRFVCDASSDDDLIYLDKVIISAFTGSNIIDNPPPSSNRESSYHVFTDKFLVYPNPTTDVINIDYTLEDDSDQNASISLQIMDVSGRIISTTKYFGSEGRITESTENLKSGLYILRLNDATGRVLYIDKVQVIKQ